MISTFSLFRRPHDIATWWKKWRLGRGTVRTRILSKDINVRPLPQLAQAQHRLAVSAVENMNRRTSPPRNIFLRLFIKQRSSCIIPAKIFSQCFLITMNTALVASELLQKAGHGLFMSTMWFFNLSWSSFGCLRAVVTHDKRCWACANYRRSVSIVLMFMVDQTLVGIAQCFLTGGG